MRLTKEILKAIPNPRMRDLRPLRTAFVDFTEIDAEAAALLAEGHGDLFLDGLRELPEEVAKAFVKCGRQDEDLFSLEGFADSGALHLQTLLSLNGLETLSIPAAECLSQSWRDPIHLDGLSSIPDEAAEALAARTKQISLRGLGGLSDRAAAALGKMAAAFPLKKSAELFQGSALDSILQVREWMETGVHEGSGLSTAAAASLSKHTGYLCLDGLRSLSEPAAEALSRHSGDLYLNGLRQLDASIATRLASHRGQCMSFDGLRSLEEPAARALAAYKGCLSFCRLEILPGPVAEALSRSASPCLFLNGVKSLSDRAADSLSRYPGELCLDGLESLSEAAAESLSGHRGNHLFLNGLSDPDGNLRPLLERHPGQLHIDRIKAPSVEESRAWLNKNFP